MEEHRAYFKKNHVILTYGLLITVSAIISLLAVKNIVISSDSISYSLVSQQIISGKGINIPLIRFDNAVPVEGTVPFAVHGLLFPMLLALLGGVTPHNYAAAQIINTAGHIGISLFSFLLMKKIYDKDAVALLTGLLVSLSYPMLWNTHHLISETLFISLTVAAMYFLTASRHSYHNRFNRHLFIAGILASAAILTRYAGIALIGMFLWEALVSIKNKKIRYQYKSLILATALPVLTITMLFIRNYILLGTMRGVVLPPPERSYLEAFTGLIKMLFQQFQLGRYSSILAVLFVMSFVFYIIFNRSLRKEARAFTDKGMDLIVIFITGYAMLIFITLAKDQPHFELRYVSPLVPFLFILFISIIVFVCEESDSRTFAGFSPYVLILSLGIITAGTCYKSFLYIPDFFYKQQRVYSILQTCTYKWLKTNYPDNETIATNMPYRLSFFGEYSTIIFPNRKFIPNVRVPENMNELLPERMAEAGAELLVLFGEIKERQFGEYIAGLSTHRETTDRFTMLHTCSDGVVYKLK